MREKWGERGEVRGGKRRKSPAQDGFTKFSRFVVGYDSHEERKRKDAERGRGGGLLAESVFFFENMASRRGGREEKGKSCQGKRREEGRGDSLR